MKQDVSRNSRHQLKIHHKVNAAEYNAENRKVPQNKAILN